MKYLCKYCGYYFDRADIEEYCPCCEKSCIVIIPDIKPLENRESHHIHPRFMNNPKGLGQQFIVTAKKHSILHGKIMEWLWEEVENKEKAIKNIIRKSKIFLGEEDDTKTT